MHSLMIVKLHIYSHTMYGRSMTVIQTLKVCTTVLQGLYKVYSLYSLLLVLPNIGIHRCMPVAGVLTMVLVEVI